MCKHANPTPSRRKRPTATTLAALAGAATLTLGILASPAQASHDRRAPQQTRHAPTTHHHQPHHQSPSRHVHRPAPQAQHTRGSVEIHIGPPQPTVQRRWVPGHYVTRVERIEVAPACHTRQYIPPVYQTRYDHRGRPYTVIVRPGRYENVPIPPRYEMREVRTWVPGHWVSEPVCHTTGPSLTLRANIRR